MIELILVAVVFYFIFHTLARRKEADSVNDHVIRKEHDPVTEEKDSYYDEEYARFTRALEESLKEKEREKPELKRSVQKIIALLGAEKIRVDYIGTVIPKCFDKVVVYFTVRYGPALVKYHIYFTDQTDGDIWQLFAGVRIDGKTYMANLPYREKAAYDQDELAWDYHVLESEVLKIIRKHTGIKDDPLISVQIVDAVFEFRVDKDWEVAFDYLHSEEHIPSVPWKYCDYLEFNAESRWKYVGSRYTDYL